MIELNPEYALITSEYKYTALHTAAYYDKRGIVPLMVEKVSLKHYHGREIVYNVTFFLSVVKNLTTNR